MRYNNHLFPGGIQICSPPAKAGICQDMMPAKAHQIKIQIPVFLLRAFDQRKTLLLLSEVFKDPLPGIVRVVCKYKKEASCCLF